MSPTPRTAILLAVVAASALLVPFPVAATLGVAVLVAFAADALAVRRPPSVHTEVEGTLLRGVPSSFVVGVDGEPARSRIRQPSLPALRLFEQEASGRLETTVIALRRGRHMMPRPAVRVDGPLGLGRWFHRPGEPVQVCVYPDIAAADRLAAAVRRGRFIDPSGRTFRGPLGLGTDFESIREYQPDDDLRHVNWRATARLGRPMTNTYRVERDRDVVVLLDTGRLMQAPLDGGLTRLDAAVDALAAVAAVADALQDRFGAVAFADIVHAHQRPRRAGGAMAVRRLFDVTSHPADADYHAAFEAVGGGKRAFVLVLTDLLEEAAAAPLLDAVGTIARRHALAVASVRDDDLDAFVQRAPANLDEALEQAVAADLLRGRALTAARLRASGADVVDAGRRDLAAACVGAYLRAKFAARV